MAGLTFMLPDNCLVVTYRCPGVSRLRMEMISMSAQFGWFDSALTDKEILINYSIVNYVVERDDDSCHVYFNNDTSPLVLDGSIDDFYSQWRKSQEGSVGNAP